MRVMENLVIKCWRLPRRYAPRNDLINCLPSTKKAIAVLANYCLCERSEAISSFFHI